MTSKNLVIGVGLGVVLIVLMRPAEMTWTEIDSATPPAQTVSLAATVTAPPAESSAVITGQDVAVELAPQRLRMLLRDSIKPATVVTPTKDQLDHFTRLFLSTLRQDRSWKELSAAWNQQGWCLERWRTEHGQFIAVCEHADQRQGRGIYVIRQGSRSGIALQAPHRFYDSDSGTITRKLMDEHDITAAAWNTVHRSAVDVAHRSDHFINAFTTALLEYRSTILVAQIHGFANEKQAGKADHVALIVSDATRYPARLARAVATELKAAFSPTDVLLYPTEIGVLGGTQNQQARVFHNLARDGFLHLEMNRDLRAKLVADASTRGQFFSALTSAADNWLQSPGR